MMHQGLFPFKYESSKTRTGLTSLAGLPTFFELGWVLGLTCSIEQHVQARLKSQGWTDKEHIAALVALNLAGGSHVEDLDRLEADEGLSEVMLQIRSWRTGRKRRRELNRRWRKEKERAFPSRSSMHRYLREFHDEAEERRREEKAQSGVKAFIPSPNKHLRGISKVNKELLARVQSHHPSRTATLDQDATLVYSSKNEALYCYKGPKAYQPFNTWWAEQQLMVHTEFRDGNVPAGHEQLRCFKEALACLPEGVEEVFLRSDTAAYQHELLRYCADGHNERFGVVPFAICCDVTPGFKKAVAKVSPLDWRPLYRTDQDGDRYKTNQEWAEVCFVPETRTEHKKDTQPYRYLATREKMSNPELPGVENEDRQLPFPTMQFDQRQYKVFGIVTNMDREGGQLINWQRERCGKSEEVHSILKRDLAGGVMPSGYFGANAAWWWITVISFNLLMAMKLLVLGDAWIPKRLKAIRFHIINLPGRVVHHARSLVIKLSSNQRSCNLLAAIRERIVALAPAPAT